jgi:hypothetical protein
MGTKGRSRMKEVKIYLSAELDTRFRKAAMENYGYGRGSLSRAAQEALIDWCRSHEKARSIEEPRTVPIESVTQNERDPENLEKKSPQPTNAEAHLPRVTPVSSSTGSS